MAYTRKRGSRWQVRWRDPDGTQRNRTVRTRSEAQALAREVDDAVSRGERWVPRGVRQEPSLRDLMEAYIIGLEAAGKAESTIRRYAHTLDMFERFVTDQPGLPRPLRGSALSESLLMAFYVSLKENGRHGRPRAESTRRKAVEVVVGLWKWLRKKREWRNFVPELEEVELAPAPRARTLAPTFAEVDAMIACASGWQRDLYTVLRYTGLRVSQAMHLRWEDVDLERELMHIRPELGKTASERRGRHIPLSRHFVQWLAGRGRREGFLIQTNREAGVRQREARSRDAKRAWKRAGVPEDRYSQRPHHSIRKAFVSELRRAGADPDAIEAYIGHDLGLRDIYTDPSAQPMRELVSLVPAIDLSTTVTRISDVRKYAAAQG